MLRRSTPVQFKFPAEDVDDCRDMQQKAVFWVLACGSLLLGGIAFFALPAHNWTKTYTFIDGSTSSDYNTCDTLDREDECSSQFWMRVGAAGLGVIGFGVFAAFGSAGTTSSRPSPQRQISPRPDAQRP
ncbi:MAG: hypothetical protein ABI595_06395, partial [Actinomycetota bacterium]